MRRRLTSVIMAQDQVLPNFSFASSTEVAAFEGCPTTGQISVAVATADIALSNNKGRSFAFSRNCKQFGQSKTSGATVWNH